jgi:hypothetical protein
LRLHKGDINAVEAAAPRAHIHAAAAAAAAAAPRAPPPPCAHAADGSDPPIRSAPAA